MRKINQRGIDLVKYFEGLYTKAYVCPAGINTIGYGHTGNVEPGQCISPEEAETLLRQDMTSAAEAVTLLIAPELTDNQFAALCSFCFNVGAGNLQHSTLRRRLNAGDVDAVPYELCRWTKATDPVTGKKRDLPGLVKRRAAEAELWLSPDVQNIPAPDPMPQAVEEATSSTQLAWVNARSGLKLRAGPGLEFDTLSVLPFDSQVAVNQLQGEWIEVDIEQDGAVDGWVYGSYLRRH